MMTRMLVRCGFAALLLTFGGASIVAILLAQPGAPASPPAPATGRILTVKGPISPDLIGPALMHEHLFIDFRVQRDTPEGWALAGRTRPTAAGAVRLYHAPLTMDILGPVKLGAPNRDNHVLDDETLATEEVMEFRRRGGGTIVDVTSIGLGRSPERLRRVSEATGLNVVMGSSWYQQGFVWEDVYDRPVESLTEDIVRDVTVGVGTTGIRAGVIGEVGTFDPSKPGERKVIQASARASRLTGAPISIHIARGRREQLRVLDVLAAEGADLTRVAMGHSNPIANDPALLEQILDRGAYVQFDLLGDFPWVGMEMSDHDVAMAIVSLVEQGHLERILLSHDVCTKADLKAYGGSGYSFIAEYFLPYLKRQGLTDAQIHTIVVENPKRLLTFAAPRS